MDAVGDMSELDNFFYRKVAGNEGSRLGFKNENF